MNKTDEAMQVPNVRLLSAVYFGLLAIIGTIIIDTVLYVLGVAELLPIFQSILFAVILASIFGALFANKIIHCKRPYKLKTFGWGFLMVILALPIYNLALIFFIYQQHTEAFAVTTPMQYVYLYFIYLFFTFILAGLWLAIVSGFAAMYLRGRLAYDILHSQNMNRVLPVEKKTKMHRSSTPHRAKHSH